MDTDTICAIASNLGRGAIGVVRISGDACNNIAKSILGFTPKPRHAYYNSFVDKHGNKIDKGIAIFFKAPHSFTGEDVLELQGHGGVIVMQNLLEAVIGLGARIAEAGEFSKRAFLNNKMDLVQAEAVADIIDASSKRALSCALRSLSGDFSNNIKKLNKALTKLRVFIEATIDFTEEEIDFLHSFEIEAKIKGIKKDLETTLNSAKGGAVLRQGLYVAIIGKPNAGKSSIFNAITKTKGAIVTNIAGTTRDILKETINIDDITVNIIDTAGLCKGLDKIEKEGIKRAYLEINKADVIVLVFDAIDKKPNLSILPPNIKGKLLLIKNKVDLTGEKIGRSYYKKQIQIALCAQKSEGINLLTKELADIAKASISGENTFLVRTRHVVALKATLNSINDAIGQLHHNAVELVAEDLRRAGQHLGSISGIVSSDELLGEIFASFCIGK